MAVSNIKAVFSRDIQTVWETVTSLENYAWRSDLSRIEVLSETRFVEYTKGALPPPSPSRRWNPVSGGNSTWKMIT